MVFTHIPSSVFLIAAAFDPSLPLTLTLLLACSALSQMVMALGWTGAPLLASGVLKIGYDLAILAAFRRAGPLDR
jgi:hypothetical protein